MPELILSNKQKINYLFNKGNGKAAIILLHGLGANLSIWQGEIDYFTKKRRSVLALDLRCHGQSFCSTNARFSDFSSDLYLILKKLKIKKIILVGHSLGGLIAMDFYKKHPGNVLSLVLIDSSYNISLKTLRSFFPIEYIMIKIASFFSRIRKNKPSRMDFQKFKRSNDLRLLYEANSSLDAATNMDGLVKELPQIDFFSLLKKISVPVLIIGDKNDEFFRVSITKKMAESIPKSSYYCLNSTHSSILKKPIKINHLIESFLETNTKN